MLIPLATSLEQITADAFWDSILLYHNNPHFVNRRLTCALLVLFLKINFKYTSIKSLSEILTRTAILYEVRKLEKVSREYITQDLIKGILEPHDKNVTIDATSVDHFKKDDGVFVTVKILLPRQQSHEACVEVAILDKINQVATFLAVIEFDKKALAPSFPYRLERLKSGFRICVDLENAESSAATWLVEHLFVKFEKWIENINDERVALRSLSLVLPDAYTKLYHNLKEKYGKQLVEAWPEKTDPLKYVYEDIAIATYLISLWQTLMPNSKPTFVDLGCGNGLLVHILNSEGYHGHGIDIRKRKIWDFYPNSTVLKVNTITPSASFLFPDTDWIIGNHSDELTPWIPVLTARSSHIANFFLLPCCCYEFSGQKYVRKNTAVSTYSEYLRHIQEIATQCGFNVKVDKLRIPSTRRTCLISTSRNYKSEQFSEIDKNISKLISEDTNSLHWSNNFQARPQTEAVRNCTQLDKNSVTNIVNKIFLTLLADKHDQTDVNGKTWNKGGTVMLIDLAKLIADDLRLLKNENGGLQTLLKNHRYIFDVNKGTVSIRWPSTVELTKGKYKDKPCWFNVNHPDGCFNKSDICAYNHLS